MSWWASVRHRKSRSEWKIMMTIQRQQQKTCYQVYCKISTCVLLVFFSSGMAGKFGTRGLLRTTEPLSSLWYRFTYSPPKRACLAGAAELCRSLAICLSIAALSLAMPDPNPSVQHVLIRVLLFCTQTSCRSCQPAGTQCSICMCTCCSTAVVRSESVQVAQKHTNKDRNRVKTKSQPLHLIRHRLWADIALLRTGGLQCTCVGIEGNNRSDAVGLMLQALHLLV